MTIYQRGADGMPIGMNGSPNRDYPRIPQAEVFQTPCNGADKPVRVHGWQWSPTFGRWGASVTFADGWTGFTWPLNQSLDELERSDEGEYVIRATVAGCNKEQLIAALQEACDDGVAGRFTVHGDGDGVRVVFVRCFSEDADLLLKKTAREQLAHELMFHDQTSDAALRPVADALRSGDSAEFLTKSAFVLRENGKTEGGHQIAVCLLPNEMNGITAPQMVAMSMEQEDAFADLVRAFEPLYNVTVQDVTQGFADLRRQLAGTIILP